MHKKAEIAGKGEPLHFVTSSVRVTPPGMVRVKTAFAGVCHSDLHIMYNELGHFDNYGDETMRGMVMGHEVSGYIDQAGEGVNLGEYGLKQGDPVVVYPWVACSKCKICKAGHSNVCTTPNGHSYNSGCGPNADGGYQTHMMVLPHALLKVPDKVPMDVACMLPCSAGTAYSALKKLEDAVYFGNLRSGKARLLIIGAGGLGLWAIQIAKALYPQIHLIVADISESKFPLAKTYGADETILWKISAKPSENAEAILENGGADAVADFCGNGPTATTALKCLSPNGALVVVGLGGGSSNVDLRGLIYSSLSIGGNCTLTFEHLSQVMSLVAQGKVKYPGCIYFQFEQLNEALAKLKKGEMKGRGIIDFNGNLKNNNSI